MPRQLIFDSETDNLLDKVTKIHCIVARDLETKEVFEFGPGQIDRGLGFLMEAELLAGWNIPGYDLQVFKKLYSSYWEWDGRLLDGKALSRVLFPGSSKTSILKSNDFAFRKRYGDAALPGQLIGIHSLKAWSYRLRLGDAGKADYDGGWEKWSPEMQAYCVRDVTSTHLVLDYFLSKGWPQEVLEMESMLEYRLQEQQANGVGFDEDKAIALVGELVAERSKMVDGLRELFPPKYRPNGSAKQATVTPKQDRSSKKYGPGHPKYSNVREGCEYVKVHLVEFNPGSTQDVARRLIQTRGWRPTNFAPKGDVQVTAEILEDLPWPECKDLARYAINKTILGYLSEGKEAWLGHVKNGRIHGRVNGTGGTSHRASHHAPNLGQVPKTGKPYGKECRELFTAGGGAIPKDWVLVGCDASALQLAIYAHYVGRYDGGALAKIIEDPDTDAHEYMMAASGLHLRDNQKTLTYATWLGAQHQKQGMIAIEDRRMAIAAGITDKSLPGLNRARAVGRVVDGRMRKNMAGYEDLQKQLGKAGDRGYIKALDGRKIAVLQKRLAMMILLQGNEAVIMKMAYLKAYDRLMEQLSGGLWVNEKEWAFVLWIHDEFQLGCNPKIAEVVGEILSQAITDTAAELGLRLKLSAEYKIGNDWGETH